MSPLTALVEEVAFQEAEAPPSAPPFSPTDELRLLEKKALEKGISNKEFVRIHRIGDCSMQVQTRIASLHEWLASH